MKKLNYLLNFLTSYKKIFLKVIFSEIIYSLMFRDFSQNAVFWSSTENDASTSWDRDLNANNNFLARSSGIKYYGKSVRFVRDSTTLTSTGTYSYQWSNGATSQDISNLGPGTYSVVITDANGCSTSKQYTVTEPALLVASGIKSSHNGFEITCNGADDGSIDLTVSGGTSPFDYSWTKTGDDSKTSSKEDI